jgi:hypothetical protein
MTTNSEQSTTNVIQNKANFKGKKLLLGLMINGWCESLRYYTDEIEAAATIHHVFCGATHACKKSMGRKGENIWRLCAQKRAGRERRG